MIQLAVLFTVVDPFPGDAPRGALLLKEGDVAEAVWGGGTQWRPLHQGAPSPLEWAAWGLIKMQGTGWQAAAAAYTKNPGRKGRRDGGGG